MRLSSVGHALVLVGVVIGWASGCGRAGGPVVHYVTGVVTLDGEPVSGASVRFSPSSPDGIPASGMTKADGTFTLNAQAARPGAGTAAGEYAVAIQKDEVPDISHLEIGIDDPRYGTPEHEKLMEEAMAVKPKAIVPGRYNDPETSGLRATVGKSGNNFQFELTRNE